MRLSASGVFAFLGLAAAVLPSRAAEAPSTFVIPGKPGVPVIINGVDASYTVVEGDWGLARPGHVTPTIVTPPLFGPTPGMLGGYFPARGIRPGYGRQEIEPPANRRLPRPAPSFHREWSTQSDPVAADVDTLAVAPPLNVEVQARVPAPRVRRRPN